MHRTRLIPLLVSALVTLAILAGAHALAQDTGGSFGGGDFGGGGGDFGGGGGSWGGGSDFGSSGSFDGGSFGSSDYSGGGGSGLGFCSTVALLVIVLAVVVVIGNAKGGGIPSASNRNRAGPVPSSFSRGMDVSAIMLGIDWRARKFVQPKLAELAKTGNTKSSAGLAALLHETVVLLRRAELSWLYSGVVNAVPSSPAQAEELFRRVAQEARSRFKHEIVRGHEGAVRTEDGPSGIRARSEEGEGVVVVTIVVASRGIIPDIGQAQNADELRSLMRSFGAIPASQLVALEVVWSPAQEEDRMSTAELEVLYPELRKIDERTIAGRVFCGYCAGPFAAELLECSHCGAPNAARSPS